MVCELRRKLQRPLLTVDTHSPTRVTEVVASTMGVKLPRNGEAVVNAAQRSALTELRANTVSGKRVRELCKLVLETVRNSGKNRVIRV